MEPILLDNRYELEYKEKQKRKKKEKKEKKSKKEKKKRKRRHSDIEEEEDDNSTNNGSSKEFIGWRFDKEGTAYSVQDIPEYLSQLLFWNIAKWFLQQQYQG